MYASRAVTCMLRCWERDLHLIVLRVFSIQCWAHDIIPAPHGSWTAVCGQGDRLEVAVVSYFNSAMAKGFAHDMDAWRADLFGKTMPPGRNEFAHAGSMNLSTGNTYSTKDFSTNIHAFACGLPPFLQRLMRPPPCHGRLVHDNDSSDSSRPSEVVIAVAASAWKSALGNLSPFQLLHRAACMEPVCHMCGFFGSSVVAAV